jgi:four helix bundle protein
VHFASLVHGSKAQRELTEQLKRRSRQFALDVIFLCRRFPRTLDAYVVAKQLIKAATATAANYRAACRSHSPSDFASRISVVSEEAEESQLWLDITIAAGIVADGEAKRLFAESSELTAIFTASRDTAKRNHALQRGSSLVSVLFLVLAVLAVMAMRA